MQTSVKPRRTFRPYLANADNDNEVVLGDGAASAGGSSSTCVSSLVMVTSDTSAEVADVFCNLGSLIVEGRVPQARGARGYVEGPHVPPMGPVANRHECSKDSPMCTKDENLRRHMLLLWQNNLPICIEVLLRPNCQISKTRAIEVAALPEPGALLLEQWTVAVSDKRSGESAISIRDLFLAIRSYLHFSQLSAWLSSSRGERPKNLLYRVTLPTDAFVMKFKQTPDNHVFPPAKAGNKSLILVSLKSLPRLDALPDVHCVHHHGPEQLREVLGANNEEKETMDGARALAWRDMNAPIESALDLRKALVRSRLAECSLLSRSDSLDSMLGDSLLDPPQNLLKMPPKRYQSPSRCGSPCLEAPELNLNCGTSKLVAPSLIRDASSFNEGRLGRQDQIRRRDADAVHPRLLHQRRSNHVIRGDHNKCRLSGKHLHCVFDDSKDEELDKAFFREAKEARVCFNNDFKEAKKGLDIDLGAKRKGIDLDLSNSSKSLSDESGSDEPSFLAWRYNTSPDEEEEDSNNVDVAKLLSLWDSDTDKKGFKSNKEYNKEVLEEHNIIDDLEQQLRLLSISSPKSEKRNFKLEPLEKIDSKLSKAKSSSELDQELIPESLNTNLNSAPSNSARDAFRKSFDSAANLVFHGRTGLPLTSSPAPLRRGKCNFDFDASITNPKSIKRALFRSNTVKAPKSNNHTSKKLLSQSAPASDSNLLGNFEESVLNGRLEPVSTVEGFTAEIGASGSFHPKHMTLPVTVFFYTLAENAGGSSPYLGHINLGKKGYRVPSRGTIQVTLFNPLGTVVKMFVVMYDLSDMPPNSQTFLRQRTLSMPADAEIDDEQAEKHNKWLRYLIHLRFASSRSGKLYLHTDVRLIIFRKSDLDTANEYALAGKSFELRSFTKGPSNPRFSPRK